MTAAGEPGGEAAHPAVGPFLLLGQELASAGATVEERGDLLGDGRDFDPTSSGNEDFVPVAQLDFPYDAITTKGSFRTNCSAPSLQVKIAIEPCA